MKKKDLLNEIAGVPKAIEPWVEVLTKVVIDIIEDSLKSKGWDEVSDNAEAKNPETGEIEPIEVFRTQIQMGGKEFMEKIMEKVGYSDMGDFIKSNFFSRLPIWRPFLELEIVGVPDWVYDSEISNSSSINAAMITNPSEQKLSKVGKVVVMPKIGLRFSPLIPSESNKGLSDRVKKDLDKMIKPTVGHELLHVYQTFKQMEGGKEGHFGPESLLNALSNHPSLKLDMFKEWKYFLRLVYLHLSFEINARVNQLYYEMKSEGVDTKEEFLRVLKNSPTWTEVQQLEDFDAKQFLKDFKLPNIGGGFLEQMLGQNLFSLEMKMRGLENVEDEENTLKSIIKLWDVILQQGSKAMEALHGMDIPMERVPKKAKEDPYLFFKFFEKRFHKNAKDFKRKLYRVSTLLIGDEDPLAKKLK